MSAKTWQKKDRFGRVRTWTFGRCRCGAKVEVVVGAAGHPTCTPCFDRRVERHRQMLANLAAFEVS